MSVLFMMSGIPRSGSSVLCSMLNQHPYIHATTTSPIIEFIEQINPLWHNVCGRLKDPYVDQYDNMIRGLIDGAYQHIHKTVIVDKNRLWPRYAPQIKRVLGRKLRIICTVRSIPEVIASYVTLINKTEGITFVDQNILDLGLPINTKNRCRIIWENYVYAPYTSLQIAFNSADVELCVCSYDQIVNDGQATLDRVCEFIGLNSFKLNAGSLMPMDENDEFHGGLKGLHDVRPTLKRISASPEQIIGQDMVKLYTSMKLEFWNR